MDLEIHKKSTESENTAIETIPTGWHRKRQLLLAGMGFIVILLIIALSYFGWKLYNERPAPKASQAAQVSAQPTDPNAGYFVIKEWGVRFKLPSNLDGLEYKITAFSDEPSSSYADFYTTKLATLIPDCNPVAGSWSVGIGRLLRYPVSNQQPITGGAGLLKTFNGYNYYYFSHDQAVCPDPTKNTSQAGIDLLNSSRSTLTSSISTLEDAKGDYLDIKEMGVKLFLNNQISDAVYAPFHTPPTDGSTVIGISSKSLDSIKSNNPCSASSGTLGLIIATTVAPTNVGGERPLPVNGKSLFKFGNTYYEYIRPQNQGCLTTSQADVALVVHKVDAFAQAFSTLQLDSNTVYLTIKELGIKIPLGDSIKDLIYSYGTQNGINFMHFSTNTLISANQSCTANADPLGTYTVYTSPQPDSGHELPGTLAVHVNGYYIYYSHVQYACVTDSTSQFSITTAIQSLLTSVQGAKAQ